MKFLLGLPFICNVAEVANLIDAIFWTQNGRKPCMQLGDLR